MPDTVEGNDRGARFVVVFWSIVGSCALAVLLLGICGYPIIRGDGAFYLPAAVSWKVTGNFVNEFWTGRAIDPSGHSRFLYHPPLLEWLIKTTMARPIARDVFPVLGTINALALTMCGLLSWMSFSSTRSEHRRPRDAWLALAFHIAGALSFLAMLFYDLGRSEGLASIFIAAAVLVLGTYQAQPPKRHMIVRVLIAGCLLGLTAATAAVAAVIAAGLLGAWCAYYYRTARAMLYLALAGAAAAGTFLAVMTLLYPYPLAEWIAGMRTHSNRVTGFFRPHQLITEMLLNIEYPLWGLLLAALAGLLAAHLWQRRGTIGTPWLFAVAMLGALAVILRYPIASAACSDYLFPLYPLLPVGIYQLSRGRANGAMVTVRTLALSVLLMMLLGPARHAVLASYYVRQGVRPAAAAALLREQTGSFPRVGMSETMWTLTEDYSRAQFVLGTDDVIDVTTGQPLRYLVIQQFGHANVTSVPGYRKIASGATPQKALFFGVALANSIPGYQFTVYEKE